MKKYNLLSLFKVSVLAVLVSSSLFACDSNEEREPKPEETYGLPKQIVFESPKTTELTTEMTQEYRAWLGRFRILNLEVNTETSLTKECQKNRDVPGPIELPSGIRNRRTQATVQTTINGFYCPISYERKAETRWTLKNDFRYELLQKIDERTSARLQLVLLKPEQKTEHKLNQISLTYAADGGSLFKAGLRTHYYVRFSYNAIIETDSGQKLIFQATGEQLLYKDQVVSRINGKLQTPAGVIDVYTIDRDGEIQTFLNGHDVSEDSAANEFPFPKALLLNVPTPEKI